ncbi:tricarballylate utilization 4Fe-4S protein TcuB [Roseitranquillus sediminis]|uniref:tricarballylate utilization 4Fe-4S protein TcuB n=1 Tax=Roseitranquillus sediminis TaxID=2809051 RepID=UPI001D0C2790|nr:tricarballylate utilization 4Fe-4S protein TcuB [Roseitranquillus sediminis]MBM9595778.1 tricarballylate utilization 4Fe-4S protein TcuB [Roseitranquillus sediminis]
MSPLDTTAESPTIAEAKRQVEICNACRYCEGFCAVFPAINRQRIFASGDIQQLAHLCHNCRGCYYSCQYTPPHEFAVNLPRILAETRAEDWDRFAWPSGFGGLFQRQGLAIAGLLVLALAALFLAVQGIRPQGGEGFYAYLSHGAMVAIFLPAFVLPLVAIGVSLRRYWRTVGGGAVQWRHVKAALMDSARLKNLSGGQGQGCNYEKEDRYSDTRRWMHQAVLYGFLLCFASTSSGTLLHYAGYPAPYGFWSLPKLLGIPGGILLTVGGLGLAWLKTQADRDLNAPAYWGGEMAFVLLLTATGLTGLVLYAATGTAAVQPLLALHLGTVLAFFLLMPYSKMIHGFYRVAALIRDAQIKMKDQRPTIPQPPVRAAVSPPAWDADSRG